MISDNGMIEFMKGLTPLENLSLLTRLELGIGGMGFNIEGVEGIIEGLENLSLLNQ